MSERTSAQHGEHVRLGSALITLVEPHRGHEVDYNRWYERDHFYGGCLIGADCFSGGRFVATRDLKQLRAPAESQLTGPADRGSFVSLYWIQDGQHEAWMRWAGTTVHELHAAGRMFDEREHVMTKLWQHDWTVHRDVDGVPTALALDHPYAGIAMVVGQTADGVDPADVDTWYRDEHLPATIAGTRVSQVVKMSLLPMPGSAPGVDASDDGAGRFIHLYFCDVDPVVAWGQTLLGHAETFAATGLGEIQFSSPFHRTVPGTDTHVDRLW